MSKKRFLPFLLVLGINASCLYGDCYSIGIQPYIGITGGLSLLSGSYTALDTSVGDTHFAVLGNTGGLIGAIVGAQTFLCDNLFIALQGNALYHTTNRVVRSSTNAVGIDNHVVKIENHFQWGMDIRLGLDVCGISPYILGGLESGNWKMSLKNDSNASNRGIPAFSTVSHARTQWGGKIGTGLTFPFLSSLSGNMEYSYTWFGDLTLLLVDSITGRVWNHKAIVRQSSILFGINYLF